jgi:hypothetical protein
MTIQQVIHGSTMFFLLFGIGKGGIAGMRYKQSETEHVITVNEAVHSIDDNEN